MKDDERKFLDQLKKKSHEDNFPCVREIVRELGIHEKRAAYICEKWASKGWHDYGVNVLAGWLTEDGLNA